MIIDEPQRSFPPKKDLVTGEGYLPEPPESYAPDYAAIFYELEAELEADKEEALEKYSNYFSDTYLEIKAAITLDREEALEAFYREENAKNWAAMEKAEEKERMKIVEAYYERQKR